MIRWHRECVKMAQELGVRHIHTIGGGKHVKMLGDYNGHPIVMPLRVEQGDYHNKMNWRAQLRKQLSRAGDARA